MKNKETSDGNIPYPEIAKRLELLVSADQDMRKQVVDNPENFDPTIDEKNTEEMKQIIDQIGWPTISKVGESGEQHAWLLVQHADHDVAFQKQCLKLMKAENQDEVSLRNIAYLEDRVRLAEGKKQLYGTQFIKENGVLAPRPIEDPENVDERRKHMGLGALKENLQEMNNNREI